MKADYKTQTTSEATRALIGSQSALSTEANKNRPPDIKDVSLRWLMGTVLTGVTSITLMGGALLTALEAQRSYWIAGFDHQTEIIEQAQNDSYQDNGKNYEKGDLPVTKDKTKETQKVFRLSTLTRSNDGNRVRSRPFAKLDSKLVRFKGEKELDIPAFDPVTIFSGSSNFREKGEDEVLYSSQVEGEIEIRHSPLTQGHQNQQALRGFSNEEVQAKLKQKLPILRTSLDDGTIFARAGAIAYIDPSRFEGKPVFIEETPYDKLVTIRSENVLTLGKTSSISPQLKKGEKRIITLKKNNQPIRDVIGKKLNLGQSNAISEKLIGELGKENLSTSHTLRLSYAGGPDVNEPDIISLFEDDTHKISLARSDDGSFVEMNTDEITFLSEEKEPPLDTKRTSIYRGVFETALRNGLDQELARELIRIYAFDVDYRSQAKSNDHMEVFYSLDPEEEKASKDSEIIYTSLTLNGIKRRYYRFKTTDDATVDYYDENGRSAKKFLMRQPVPRAKFRSSFGWRRHPILRTSRLHKGVDWSAPRGTPIFAAGNGVIEDAKWFSGYGRWIKIRHANGYKTGYAHMSRFAKGMKPGKRVRQGQIIGYVGSTGLSTGPHLHYEVIVNGRHVDPMRIRLPRGRSLKGEQLIAFERERNRIDQLLDTASHTEEQDFALNN